VYPALLQPSPRSTRFEEDFLGAFNLAVEARTAWAGDRRGGALRKSSASANLSAEREALQALQFILYQVCRE